jgi:hypothetical protein
MRNLPPDLIRQIPVVQIHRAKVPETLKEREQIPGIRGDAFELYDGTMPLDEVPGAGERAEFVSLDVAFDELEIVEFEIIKRRQRNGDGFIAGLPSLRAQ